MKLRMIALALATLSSAPLLASPTASFNLARFIRENPKTAKWKEYVAPGDAYIGFGSRDKYSVETNLLLEARGGGITQTAGTGATATYFLDAYVFGDQIAEGSLIDIGANADFGRQTLEAHVRVLGDDKWKGSVSTVYDQTFVRDFPYEKVLYGVPMLGVKVVGSLGGELGLRASPHLRVDNVFGAHFIPRVNLHAFVAGQAEALTFISAEAKGTVKILEAVLNGTANLGMKPASSFFYGNVGVDSTDISALDGLVELYAKADLSSFPSGVSKFLWTLLGTSTDGQVKEWKHTLWDPEPVYTKTLGYSGKHFVSFARQFASIEDCDKATKIVGADLASDLFRLGIAKDKATGLEGQAFSAAIQSVGEIRASAVNYCYAEEEKEEEESFVAESSDDDDSGWNTWGAFSPFE